MALQRRTFTLDGITLSGMATGANRLVVTPVQPYAGDNAEMVIPEAVTYVIEDGELVGEAEIVPGKYRFDFWHRGERIGEAWTGGSRIANATFYGVVPDDEGGISLQEIRRTAQTSWSPGHAPLYRGGDARDLAYGDGDPGDVWTLQDDGSMALQAPTGSGSGGGDADTLDGQEGTYYLNRANHTGSQAANTITGLGDAATKNTGTAAGTVAAGDHTHPDATTTASGHMSAPDKVKLNGIASGATANATDADLRARASHTGEQAIATITGLSAELAAKAAAADLAGHTGNTDNPHAVTAQQAGAIPDTAGAVTDTHIAGMAAGKLTGAITGAQHGTQAGGGLHAEATTDTAGFLSAAGKSKLDGIATGATANATDAALRDRTTHTGTQAISTVTDLQTSLDDKERRRIRVRGANSRGITISPSELTGAATSSRWDNSGPGHNDYVVVHQCTDPTFCGIWRVNTGGAWTRHPYPITTETRIYTSQYGDNYRRTLFVCDNETDPVIGTDPVTLRPLQAFPGLGSLSDAQVAADAAIAYSKLDLAGHVLPSDIDPTGSTAGQFLKSTGDSSAPIWDDPPSGGGSGALRSLVEHRTAPSVGGGSAVSTASTAPQIAPLNNVAFDQIGITLGSNAISLPDSIAGSSSVAYIIISQGVTFATDNAVMYIYDATNDIYYPGTPAHAYNSTGMSDHSTVICSFTATAPITLQRRWHTYTPQAVNGLGYADGGLFSTSPQENIHASVLIIAMPIP